MIKSDAEIYKHIEKVIKKNLVTHRSRATKCGMPARRFNNLQVTRLACQTI